MYQTLRTRFGPQGEEGSSTYLVVWLKGSRTCRQHHIHHTGAGTGLTSHPTTSVRTEPVVLQKQTHATYWDTNAGYNILGFQRKCLPKTLYDFVHQAEYLWWRELKETFTELEPVLRNLTRHFPSQKKETKSWPVKSGQERHSLTDKPNTITISTPQPKVGHLFLGPRSLG